MKYKKSSSGNSGGDAFKDTRVIHPEWQDHYDRVCEDAKIAGVKFFEIRETYRQWILERDSTGRNYPEHEERRCKGIAAIKAQFLANEKYPRLNLETGEPIKIPLNYDMFALPFNAASMRSDEFQHNLKLYLKYLKDSAIKHGNCVVYPSDLSYNIVSFDPAIFRQAQESKKRKIW